MMKKTVLLIIVSMLLAQTVPAIVISNIEQLDSEAEFHFSIMSDNKTNGSGDTRTGRAISWIQATSEFCFGLGDTMKGGPSSDGFDNDLRNNSWFHNNFYPHIGDGECQAYGGSQSAWPNGANFFKEVNDWNGRSNVFPNTLEPQSSSGYRPSYYAKFMNVSGSGINVHLLSCAWSDSRAFDSATVSFLNNKLTELAAAKTDNDIIMVLGHDNGGFIGKAKTTGKMTTAQLSFLIDTADFVCDASSHSHGRHITGDSKFEELRTAQASLAQQLEQPGAAVCLWMNSGHVHSQATSRYGYLEIHVFSNPTRFTVQYLDLDKTSRQLHTLGMWGGNNNFRNPVMKEVNGPITYVDWNNFQVGSVPNNSQFISQNVPSSLTPGATTNVTVTLKNTGTDTWTTAAGHALGSQNPQGNNTWTGASRVDLPNNVAPNAQVTFSFSITAPTNAGTYNFQWKMVDDVAPNQEWFGAATPNIPINVSWEPLNLLQNPSFELGGTTPDSWNTSAAYTRSNADKTDGSYSLKGTGSGSIGSCSQTIAVTPYTDYDVSAKIKLLTGGAGSVVLDLTDKPAPTTEVQFIQNNANSSWQAFEGSFNSSNETAITLRVFTTATFSGTFYVDDIKLSDPNTVVLPNYPPEFDSTPDTYADAGSLYSYTILTSDADEDPVTVSVDTKPSWLTLAGNVLSGTPSVGDIGGVNDVTLRATDGTEEVFQSFSIQVSAAGNDAPEIDTTQAPESGVIENNLYEYTIDATDADGDTLTYSAPVTPGWLTLNGNVLSGTPAPADVGLHPVTLSVSDGTVSVEQSFNIMVFSTPLSNNLVVNGSFEQGTTQPTDWVYQSGATGVRTTTLAQEGGASLMINQISTPIKQENIPITIGETYNISVRINSDGLTGGNAVFDTADKYDGAGQGQFVVGPDSGGWNQYTGSFVATNTSITVRIFAVNTNFAGTVYFDNVVLSAATGGNVAPAFTSDPVTEVDQDVLYSYTLAAADAEDDPLTFIATDIPGWLNLNNDVLSGTPTQGGDYPVTVSISDGTTTVDQDFTITVISTLEGYDAWAVDESVTGAETDDDDGDGRDNLFEYAVGGNPHSGSDVNIDPVLVKEGGLYKYKHLRRKNDSNLSYTVEVCTDLTANSWNPVDISTGTNALNATFDEIEHTIPTVDTQSYIRLKVINP